MIGAFTALASQFPPPESAREDGLLCMGGDLRPERLIAAYSRGIFPWYSQGVPILWWSPDPRCVMPLEGFRLPPRSARKLRLHPFELTHNAAFGRVIRACATPRDKEGGTWIIDDMMRAYEDLHALGYAHSIEAWHDGELVGGLYGVALGRAFFGESMFHTMSEASRAALAGLVALLRQRGATLLDCQQETPHIMRMGGVMLPREEFQAELKRALAPQTQTGAAHGCATPEMAGNNVPFPWLPWGLVYSYSPSDGFWLARS